MFSVYQIRQNKKTNIDFIQDLEVMEALIAENPSKASITEIFGFLIPSTNEEFLDEWADLDEVEDFKAKGKKASGTIQDEKMGLKVLLLLGYIMVTHVRDYKSKEMEM